MVFPAVSPMSLQGLPQQTYVDSGYQSPWSVYSPQISAMSGQDPFQQTLNSITASTMGLFQNPAFMQQGMPPAQKSNPLSALLPILLSTLLQQPKKPQAKVVRKPQAEAARNKLTMVEEADKKETRDPPKTKTKTAPPPKDKTAKK